MIAHQLILAGLEFAGEPEEAELIEKKTIMISKDY